MPIAMRLRWMLLVLSSSVLAVEPGAPAPAISGTHLLTDQSVDLSNLRGKVVLVDFWAAWCAPCLKSLPLYEALRAEIGTQNFEVVAVNVDEDLDSARRFLAQHPVSFPVLHDDGQIASTYAPPTMPTSYLLDRDGIVEFRHLGFKPADIDELRTKIRGMVEARIDD